jgi:hypothetical protein
LILTFVFLAWVLPSRLHNGLVFASLSYVKETGIAIALAIALYLAYRVYRVIKTEESPSQEFIKMIPTIIIWIIALGCLSTYLDNQLDNTDCEKYNYNDKLNGGVKEFNGKKYTINICGGGVNNSHFFGDSMDSVQLTITDEQGQLLAKRRYKVFWDAQPGHEPLIIGKNSITYQDDDKQTEHTVDIPPTFLDWIRSRLPFSN